MSHILHRCFFCAFEGERELNWPIMAAGLAPLGIMPTPIMPMLAAAGWGGEAAVWLLPRLFMLFMLFTLFMLFMLATLDMPTLLTLTLLTAETGETALLTTGMRPVGGTTNSPVGRGSVRELSAVAVS